MDERDIIDFWFERKGLSKNTREVYNRIIHGYALFIGKTIKELYDEADNEEEERIRLKRRGYIHYTLKFIKHLKEEGKSPNTVNTSINAIVGFYSAHDIQPPTVTREKGDIILEKNYGWLLTQDDIKKLVNVANARDTAIIYIMALSGMSQRELRDLTLQKFLEAAKRELTQNVRTIYELLDHEEDLKDTILTLAITRKKVHYRYLTFMPPETVNKILIYLRERYYSRNDQMEDLKQPLLVRSDGSSITGSSMNAIFRTLGRRAGFQHEHGTYRPWRSHSLRKYFISTIMNNLHNKVLADYMAGHKIDPVTRAYWREDPEKLKEEYLRALSHLSLEDVNVVDIYSKEVQKVLTDLDELKGELDDYQELKPLLKLFNEDKIIQNRVRNHLEKNNVTLNRNQKR